MSNAIQFLESLGRNPALGQPSAESYAASIAALDIDTTQRRTLLDRDVHALGALVGARDKMFCLILTPDQEPARRDDDDNGEDEPEKEKQPPSKES